MRRVPLLSKQIEILPLNWHTGNLRILLDQTSVRSSVIEDGNVDDKILAIFEMLLADSERSDRLASVFCQRCSSDIIPWGRFEFRLAVLPVECTVMHER